MASLTGLPTEIRLRIWRYILPHEVGVSLDEYLSRTRVTFSPDGKPIILHRVAYAATTAAHLRLLNRQIYAEVLSIGPPLLCPRVRMADLHFSIGRCSHLIKQSLRRLTILDVDKADPAECLRRYFKDVEPKQRSEGSTPSAVSTDEAWITFAVGRPYPDTLSQTRRRHTDDRRCCDPREQTFAWIVEDPDYSDGDDAESDVDDGLLDADSQGAFEAWDIVEAEDERDVC